MKFWQVKLLLLLLHGAQPLKSDNNRRNESRNRFPIIIFVDVCCIFKDGEESQELLPLFVLFPVFGFQDLLITE